MRVRFRSALVLTVAAITVAVGLPGTAQAATGAKWGYVMDDNWLATTDYTPSLDIERQSNGRRGTIHHSGVGSYTVTFPGLAATGNTGVAQVTGDATPGSCQTSGWHNSSGNVLVGVLCFANGAPADQGFFATYAVGAGTRAFGYAQDTRATTSGPVPAGSSFDGLGGAITSTRRSVGSFVVAFPHLAGSNGTVKVTPVGSAQTLCTIGGWGGGTVNVHCADAAGSPKDSTFDVGFAKRLSLLGVPRTGGYVRNSSLDQSYTDSDAYSFDSAGGGITVERIAPGLYQMWFSGVGSSNGGHVQTTAYGTTSAIQCNAAGAWNDPTTLVEYVDVQCADPAGTPVDSLFTAQYFF